MTWNEAQVYVQGLNSEHFAGRSNWRLPTVTELSSLLTETGHIADLCIEAYFFSGEKMALERGSALFCRGLVRRVWIWVLYPGRILAAISLCGPSVQTLSVAFDKGFLVHSWDEEFRFRHRFFKAFQ